MDTDGLILVANPGSASRKYALYTADLSLRASLHFEIEHEVTICTLHTVDESRRIDIDFDALTDAVNHVESILRSSGILDGSSHIMRIGLRIVAPSEFFMRDHIITDEVIEKLEDVQKLAPIHITATLGELTKLREAFPGITIVGVSDSAFHATKPPYAWNYGIDIHDADRLGIKRFGYHGISIAASIDTLWGAGKLPPKVVVCHLGSGSSVTGVFHGRSIDTTMGYTPLEGVIMATRSGSIDYAAVRALQRDLSLNDDEIEDYLHHHSGLIGLGGSDDIRTLIEREADGDHMAHLALTTLTHSIHKAIGSMIIAMNGCDLVVFTGTVGERSSIIRRRIVSHLECLDFILDGEANDACTTPEKMTIVSQKARSRPVIVIPTDEAREIAKHTQSIVA